MAPSDSPPPPAPRRPRWSGAARAAFGVVLGLLVLVALLVGAAALFLPTETALRLVVRELERATYGQLAVEGASGSLLSTVRAQRIAWNGENVRVEASDVALEWSPRALLSRRVAIRGIGIGRLRFASTPSERKSELPRDLSLPIEVEIDRAAVGQLEWQAGGRSGVATGLELGYRGGAREHEVHDFVVVLEQGKVVGNATLGAHPPFALRAALELAGNASVRDLRARATLAGTIARALDASATGAIGDARFDAFARVLPLADPPLESIAVDAREIDLAAFDARLPTTRIGARVQSSPTAQGLAGTIALQNGAAGAWDASRLPLAAWRSRFDLSPGALALSDITAELPGGGRASGSASVAFASEPWTARWSLAVADLDLARIHGRLVATQLNGKLDAQVAQDRQSVSAELRQQGMALALDASRAGDRIDVAKLRANAGGGELSARGFVVLDAERPFEVDGTFARFDPSRFGRFPAAHLTGNVSAKGTLAPAWTVDGRVAVAPGSALANLPVSGTAKGFVSPGRVHDATLDLHLGEGRLTATGDAGQAGDRLAFSVDAPRLAQWVALAPERLPRSLSGALRAKGTITFVPGAPGVVADVHGERLRYEGYAASLVDAHVDIAPGGDASRPLDLGSRRLSLKLDARGVTLAARAFATLAVDAGGTLAEHSVEARASGEDFAVAARVHGAAREMREPSGWAWSGTVDALENRGRYPFRLEAPTTISYAGGALRVGPTTASVAEGRLQLHELAIDHGNIATSGSFNAIPLAAAARLAGVTLPVATDLVLGGEWQVASRPRWNGRIDVRRERGDVYASETLAPDRGQLALGITALALEARIVDDAIDAKATLRSTRAGAVDATLAVPAVPGAAPGQIDRSTPIKAALHAQVATLRPLQPWIGTTAVVDGRATLDASASGPLGDPKLHLQLAADDLRVDAPQWGLSLSGGRLRAQDEGEDLVISELSFRGGDGTFVASGKLASFAPDRVGAGASGNAHWTATNFRVLNRPDMRLVVDGNGTLALQDGRIALRGSVKVDEGHFEYSPRAGGTLSEDVVVVGREPREREAAAGAARPPRLALDLDVGLGNRLTFVGEGLETGLRGRVHVSTNADGRLVGRGRIETVNGTYFAYGQKLSIERGALIFDGPLDNPALDIVALRRNQAVEAGVAVTGTVKVPLVTLTSNPPVPDSEKLSWLVLGRSADAGSAADAAALQAAAAALLSRGNQRPLTSRIAERLGLSDISIEGRAGATGAASGGTFASQVVVLGKRITDRLSVAYEQGLSAASNAIRIEYLLTRRLTARLEVGRESSLGLYYRRTYD